MERIKIDLVIVTYNPNLELLLNLIKSIQSQVRNIYIIDNTESKHICLNNIENIEIIQLNVNMSIFDEQIIRAYPLWILSILIPVSVGIFSLMYSQKKVKL